ncbi:MAG: hypothetical protein ABI687_04470 [Flavitalea sp.]
MRLLLLILISFTFHSLEAQTPLSFGVWNGVQHSPFAGYNRINDNSGTNTKWQLNAYRGLSANQRFFNGANVSMLSAPMGLQLDRRLNKNLYAFAGVSVAPTYFNFNRTLDAGGIYKTYLVNSLFTPNNLGLNSRVELGLMYINDEKTFSISGSIHVDRNNYQAYPLNGIYTNRQQPNTRF